MKLMCPSKFSLKITCMYYATVNSYICNAINKITTVRLSYNCRKVIEIFNKTYIIGCVYAACL